MPTTGNLYDKIADWWNSQHLDSKYGLDQLETALQFVETKRTALDVGCGSGGRMISKLLAEGFSVKGIDVSSKMIEIAKAKHPQVDFQIADIIDWQSNENFDFIMAWDSIFHLPLKEQENVIRKLCKHLNPNGILFYTFGDAVGEHHSDWLGEKFYYSSLGINGNLKILMENNFEIKHLELDQFPEKHVFVIAKKLAG